MKIIHRVKGRINLFDIRACNVSNLPKFEFVHCKGYLFCLIFIITAPTTRAPTTPEPTTPESTTKAPTTPDGRFSCLF